ncbi:hypothetical protein DFS34DRAFT_609312 [Phlyctochytrium arcticum]|nr:hypothetical protein DFS34DRAFT_609312 [Phlyctochytrium arcticum]
MQIFNLAALLLGLTGVSQAIPAPVPQNGVGGIVSVLSSIIGAAPTRTAASTRRATTAVVLTRTITRTVVAPATVQPITADTATATAAAPAGTPRPTGAVLPPICRRAGCNAELCVTNSRDAILSPCVWKPEFACFSDAFCGYNSTRRTCEWRQTESLGECIRKASPAIASSTTRAAPSANTVALPAATLSPIATPAAPSNATANTPVVSVAIPIASTTVALPATTPSAVPFGPV